MEALKALSVTAKAALGALLLGLIALASWYVFFRPAQQAEKTVQAKTETVAANAQTGAATDTVHIVVDRQAAEVRIIRTTEENTREILAQPGATTVVDPALHAAGIRALCVRDNVSDVQCASVLHDAGGRDGAQ